METTEFLQIIFSGLIWKLPVLIVLAAAIYCVVNFSKHPKVNRTALSGILILLAVDFISLFLPILQAYLLKHYGSGVVFGYFLTAIGFVTSAVYATGLSVILYAVWVGRNQK